MLFSSEKWAKIFEYSVSEFLGINGLVLLSVSKIRVKLTLIGSVDEYRIVRL